MAHKRKRRSSGITTLLAAVTLLLSLTFCFATCTFIDKLTGPKDSVSGPDISLSDPVDQGKDNDSDKPGTTDDPTEPSQTLKPGELGQVVSSATISSQGDLLMHQPIIECSHKGGIYDFEHVFRYLKSYTSAYDYAVANLETTFGGESFVYQGNPQFNCPDSFVNYVSDAGYDMLLTANNHAADTLAGGITRTLEIVRGKGIATLGTHLNDTEKKYEVVEVNGIKIGMVCFTYGYSHDGVKFSLNGLAPIEDVGAVNFFMNDNLDKLYNEAQQHMDAMKAEGAEVTMFYIHWGTEYQTTENTTQNKIAQRLCDMGFDVIVGGHAHVVQPVELLESTVDPDHKTVCIYSMGNAVSNQRTGISSLFPDGYTEDGVLFAVTFEKYENGEVYLANADVMPTWVNMHTNNGTKEYNIIPLEKAREGEWKSLFHMTEGQYSSAKRSYDRTMGIVGEGIAECQEYLSTQKDIREGKQPVSYENAA